jgi:putative nucleotidyltransferase with HDIG domain
VNDRPADYGSRSAPRESASVVLLITVVASLASSALVGLFGGAWHSVSDHPIAFLSFSAVTLVLQLAAVEVYGRGAVSFSSTGLLALGFTLGPGAAMVTAIAAALSRLVHARGKLHRGIYDAAGLALSAAAGTGLYAILHAGHLNAAARLGVCFLSGAIYYVVNIGLLSLAMSLSEGTSALAVWRDRFRWMTPHSLATGPLAFALVLAYEKVGLAGLFAFSLPPAFMMLSVRQYLGKTRETVEQASRANAELSARNETLHDLFTFTAGLAACAHDRGALTAYVEESLSGLTGGTARVRIGRGSGGTPLISAGMQVGSLSLLPEPSLDTERWERLRAAIVPQIATAIEGADLIERVRKTHLDTIAALSRSMEAKDYYTGGHTERVAMISVALAKRLGFRGDDLDAIHIGALLHDIGKIGIPERILHKPEGLDEKEWNVMREHPVISDYILSEIDLPPIVREIVRYNHERIDGAGYPDGLSGDEIPLAARIVLVADAFDALTTDRPYRRARPVTAALQEVRRNAGSQFCPQVVEALEAIHRSEPQILAGPSLRVASVA